MSTSWASSSTRRHPVPGLVAAPNLVVGIVGEHVTEPSQFFEVQTGFASVGSAMMAAIKVRAKIRATDVVALVRVEPRG